MHYYRNIPPNLNYDSRFFFGAPLLGGFLGGLLGGGLVSGFARPRPVYPVYPPTYGPFPPGPVYPPYGSYPW